MTISSLDERDEAEMTRAAEHSAVHASTLMAMVFALTP